ncbi:floricaula/leafy-like protein isoform X2 [Cryptomeria japonica]|uniref:floricaula/leafy-like protein isoform X2 n=1 Tax=Cryptomeria japonica TaxID=3369 RepID=UPI0025ACC6CA|nr:floricaula/leafy-like protein isoform X2 [Cryptomeria japonica]
MDPDSFPAFFKWDPRSITAPQLQRGYEFPLPNAAAILMPNGMNGNNRKELSCLEELFRNYGVRCITLTKMVELGFTANTLVNMTEQELDDVVRILVDIYSLDLLVGEKYGIKSAIRAERRRLDEAERKKHMELFADLDGKQRKIDENALDTLSQEGTDPMLLLQNSGHLSTAVSGLMTLPDNNYCNDQQLKACKKQKRRRLKESGEDGEDRQREHPFIVTEPGELARGKKNGLDYLFDLYEQCGKFLLDVQHIAKERGEKCPTKVTNQVFRHAKHSGAGYINKPKMRHYVHCYALHCLDVEQSNRLRRTYKERGENVGAWRQACYYPLVDMAKENGWDIEGVFNKHEKLRIWYVPTKLRQLCHLEKSQQQ